MPRPQVELDPKVVEGLARIGCTFEEMAEILGVSAKTLQRRFVHVINKGRLQAKASLRRKQFEVAMNGNATMLIWLGKQELGQSDRKELTGKHGGPIEHRHGELANIPDDQLDKEIGRLQEATQSLTEGVGAETAIGCAAGGEIQA